MTTENICECGHSKERHFNLIPAGKGLHSILGKCNQNCSCKKFKPQSQEQFSRRASSQATPDTQTPEANSELNTRTSGDFVLSDKLNIQVGSQDPDLYHWYKEEDVKEFVRRLKEMFKGVVLSHRENEDGEYTYIHAHDEIDKLAGEKLI